MPYLTLKGVKVFYASFKVSRKSSAPDLVFIHGAGGSQAIWTYQLNYFKEKANVYVPELPGHGKSEGLGASSIAEYAEIVKDFLAALALTSVTLIGHSMGGAITQYLALHNPSQLKRIVLAGTGARLKVTPEIMNRIQDHFLEVLSTITNYGFGSGAPQELITRVQEQMRQNGPDILHKDFEACNQFNLMEEVHQITLPTLILCGKADLLTPPKYSRYLHEHISDSVLKLIDGAGHMLMLEKPEAFNRELEAFCL